MLKLSGMVVNIFKSPEGKNRDTGETYGGEHKVQFQCVMDLRNGEKRIDLVTLTCKDPEKFRRMKNKWVEVAVGAFAAGRQVRFYILPDETVVPLESAA